MNKSGISPSLDRVVVEPEELEETTEGGIVIPKSVKDEHANAQVFGTLIDHGPDAWSDYTGPAANIGDRVMFAKYGGLFVIGEDGKQYRVMNDTDITAQVSESVAYGELSSRKSITSQNNE